MLAALAGAAIGAPLLSARQRAGPGAKPVQLLNVSYDPTRELYKDINAAYAAYWKGRTGQTVTIDQSHGGSGAQARAVIDGLAADVVTLALAYDIDSIAQRAKLLPPNWQIAPAGELDALHLDHRVPGPQGQSLEASTAGPIILKPGITAVVPNPKTSGGARWAYLAAWASALKAPGGNDAKARAYVTEFYKQRAGAGFRRPRLDRHLRPARHRRRAGLLGERGAPGAGRVRRRQVRHRHAADLDPGRAAGGAGRQGGRPQGHPHRRRRAT